MRRGCRSTPSRCCATPSAPITPHFTALTLREAVLSEIEQVMLRYVQFVLERKVRSVEFLNLLRRESATVS